LTDWHLGEPLPQLLEGVMQMFVEFVVPHPTFTVTLFPLPENVISGAPVVYQL
jgi:hypothetical protein